MTPASSEQSELLTTLRQQLILAQVRIMELEDARDSLAPQLAESESLLRAAQQLADTKIDEAAHAARVLADAQARAAALDARLADAARTLAEQIATLDERAAAIARLEAEIARLRAELAGERSNHAATAARLAAVTSSRSWRWTAWLRALFGSS
ncbi:MAG: hypothetical protein KF715_06850 [Candidatus Didemnitutus sp.]|nr:hypothetical protein [Candidatus Didemnitutus sp.]